MNRYSPNQAPSLIKEYMVVTEEEAEELFEEWMEDYIEECIFPQIELEVAKNYFNREAFKRDTRLSDGRGPCLAVYDGKEEEQTIEGITYFIYRTN